MNSTCELGDDAARVLKPYPDYKDSGVPWLGEVPKHWEVLPNRALFAEVKERDHPEEQMLSVTITKGVIRQQALLVDSSKKDSSNQDKSAYKLVRPGDIAYNKMRAWQGAVGVSDYQGIVSPAYVVERPRDGTDSRYLHYWLRTPAFSKEAERWSYGITSDMWSLRPEHFKMIYGCLPPLPEQAAIVRFLDHADRRIRRYIRAQQQLVMLLEAQKQAIIHQAITGQIDVRTGRPFPAYKPSGVPWLGDVPAHWEVRRLKTLCSMKSGDSITTMSIEPTGEYPVYGGNGLRGYTSNYTHDGNFALIGRQGALCGNVHIARGQFWASEHAVVATIHSDDVLEWFGAILRVMNLNQYSIAAAQPGLAVERVLNRWLPVPLSEEQAVIATYIEQHTGYINVAVNRESREVSLLREYRTRLIADVVTGKLDVREAAARLPAEVEELEPLDEADALIDGEEEPTDALATVP